MHYAGCLCVLGELGNVEKMHTLKFTSLDVDADPCFYFSVDHKIRLVYHVKCVQLVADVVEMRRRYE